MADYEPASLWLGAELRRRRTDAGLSISALADRIHFSKGFISKVETGLKSPSLDFVRLVDATLGANGELIAMVAPAAKASEESSQDSAVGEDRTQVSRIDGSPTASGDTAETALGFDGDASLAAFRSALRNLRDLGQVLDPSQVMEMLRPHASVLRQLARTSEPSVAREVSLVASHFAEFAGWMAQEMGDDVAALRWTDEAVELARAAGDKDVVAYAYVRRANIALYQQDSYGTIAFARQALTMECSNRIKGLAAQREAQGHALAGDYDAFRRCLSLSADLLARSAVRTTGEMVLGSTKIPDPVGLAEGWSLHDLGRSEEAAKVLTRLLESTPRQALRARARISARLALALATVNDVDRACEVIHPVLALGSAARSATIRSDLRQLARILNRRSADPTVQKIMPELSSALTPAGTGAVMFRRRPGT